MAINLPNIEEYNYELNEKNIAFFPSEKRNNSKLLVAHKKPFLITEFCNLIDFISQDSILILNETKVIPARILFFKPSGAQIEVFLIKPTQKSDFASALLEKETSEWEVLIGNAAKWKEGDLCIMFYDEDGNEFQLIAKRIANNIVKFEWNNNKSFAEIIDIVAHIPLPPYIHRSAQKDDKERYQTVFSKYEGSVAAPTAGLHFTNEQLQNLSEFGIKQAKLTLHVGIGTFRPVKGEIGEHIMHSENFAITKEQIDFLVENIDKNWVVVGTTALRAIESLYVFAEKTLNKLCEENNNFVISQWDKAQSNNLISRKNAFVQLQKISEKLNCNLSGSTSLFITKGQPVRCADYLITNFHQPKSTLLMLVDAFASESWKEVYRFALENQMRFLSYGDACLFRNKTKISQ